MDRRGGELQLANLHQEGIAETANRTLLHTASMTKSFSYRKASKASVSFQQ